MAAKKRWLSMAGGDDLDEAPTQPQQLQQQSADPEGAMPLKKRLMLQLKHQESQKKRVSLSEYYRKKTSNSSTANAAKMSAAAISEAAASDDRDPSADAGADDDMEIASNCDVDADISTGGSYDKFDMLLATPINDLDASGDGGVLGLGNDIVADEPVGGDELGHSSSMLMAATSVTGGLLQMDELGEATDAREYVLQQQRRKRSHREQQQQQHSSRHGADRHHQRHERHKSHRHHQHRHDRHERLAGDKESRRHRHSEHRHRHRGESAGGSDESKRAANAFDAFVERQMRRMRQRQADKARDSKRSASRAGAALSGSAASAAGPTPAELLRQQLELREGEKVQRAESFIYGDPADAAAQPIVPVSSSFIDRVVASTSGGGQSHSAGATSSQAGAPSQQPAQQRQVAVVKPQISSLLGGIVRLVASSLGDVQRNLQRQMLQQQQQQQQPLPPPSQRQAKPSTSTSTKVKVNGDVSSGDSGGADVSDFLGVAGYGSSVVGGGGSAAPAAGHSSARTSKSSKSRRS